ncbi:MAG TPA: hypothetical protein VFJ16_04615, partial [Longimicrobium sp.]|nr:hypothetical protein [Longimicrobium sp.]
FRITCGIIMAPWHAGVPLNIGWMKKAGSLVIAREPASVHRRKGRIGGQVARRVDAHTRASPGGGRHPLQQQTFSFGAVIIVRSKVLPVRMEPGYADAKKALPPGKAWQGRPEYGSGLRGRYRAHASLRLPEGESHGQQQAARTKACIARNREIRLAPENIRGTDGG